MPIWTGFGALLIAAFTIAKSTPVEKIYLVVAIIVFGSLINVLYFFYTRGLVKAIGGLNTLMTERERHYSQTAGWLNIAPGFNDKQHEYVQFKSFPSLQVLFVLVNVILLTGCSMAILYA
jgi:divalent metal cation (Fe/Co/Zn/Cd) transporter